jgi:heme exporter protein B
MLRAIGPGLFWTVVLLFGVLVTVRRTADMGGTTGIRLGIDPAASFLGAAAANAVLLLVFEAVVGVVAVLLYDLDTSGWPWLLAVVPGVAVGLGLLGTLAAAVSASARSPSLVPFLVAPLAVPLLIGATQAAGLEGGGGILPWVLMVLLVDVVALVLGVVTARPLQEAG